MAHQTHNIPWTVLASNLKLRRSNPCQHDATNFHLCRVPDRGKKLNYFRNASVRNAVDHARTDRMKYPETSYAESDDEVIISDELAKRISATVYRWRLDHTCSTELGPVNASHRHGLCPHKEDSKTCGCPLPYRMRKQSAFLERILPNPCYHFYKFNRESFFNLEVVKTLLLYGEMEPLLRVTTHPYIRLRHWWARSLCPCEEADIGWNQILRLAVDSYILLNVLHCFPGTWNNDNSSTIHYTSTKAYQSLLYSCTKSGWLASDVSTYPHRQFFGVNKGQFSKRGKPRDRARWGHLLEGSIYFLSLPYYPFGLMPLDEFLAFETPLEYHPTGEDVTYVRWMLCKQGLPVELSSCILDLASYMPQRRLPVPNDPLHPDNREELDKYIGYCWQLIVRCTMFGLALDIRMENLLRYMVAESIQDLFGCQCIKLYERIIEDGWDGDRLDFM